MKPARKKSGSEESRRRRKQRPRRNRFAWPCWKAIRFASLDFAPFSAPGPSFSVRSCTVPLILKALDDDVVLMTRNRGAAFYSAMSALKAVRPGVRIIVTGPGSDDEDILRAIAAGAKGYIPDDASPAEFKQAIRVVHSGSVWAPRRVLATFIERVTASTTSRQVKPHDGQMISRRQRQVLGFLAVGSSNREIAKELGLTERTVKAHVAELLRKIGAPNRIALSVHPITHTLLAMGR